MDTKLGEAALRLKKHLFGTRYDLGFLGVGTEEIFVYVHGRRKQWEKAHVAEWEGYPVTWRYKVGPTVAAVADFA